MTESNQYLKIEILMDGGITLYHYERVTSNESITFNNFVAKFGRDANGFITIKDEEDSHSSINVHKVIKLTPHEIQEL